MWTCKHCGKENEDFIINDSGLICQHCGETNKFPESLTYPEYVALVDRIYSRIFLEDDDAEGTAGDQSAPEKE